MKIRIRFIIGDKKIFFFIIKNVFGRCVFNLKELIIICVSLYIRYRVSCYWKYKDEFNMVFVIKEFEICGKR